MSINSRTKTIIAVHGVGNQTIYETVKKVLVRFVRYHNERNSRPDDERKVAVPLGFFHNEAGVHSEDLIYTDENGKEVTTIFNFAEAYWADIPREMVDKGFLIEEAKSWGQSVVGRIDTDSKSREKMREVLKEVLDTLKVLEKLFFLTEKMGIFKFDLNQVVEDTLDDVQVVGDFIEERKEIVDAFERQVCLAYLHDPEAEIYFVAHSEGTVVSLLGILRAACQPDEEISITDQIAVKRGDWLNRVRGYMTIGSPIDKHIALWGHIFNDLKPPVALRTKIEWRNYYDFGDPIGFELNDARERVNGKNASEWKWGNVFNFVGETEGHKLKKEERNDDYGFTRYPLPGAAHNEYWTDPIVFDNFIENVVYPSDKPAPTKLPNKWWTWPVSNFLPYVFDFALLFCGVLVLYKYLKDYLSPGAEDKISAVTVGLEVLSLTCLLAGLTFVARIVRLAKPGLWWVFGAIFLAWMWMAYYLCLPDGPFTLPFNLPYFGGNLDFSYLSIGIAIIVAALNLLFPKWGMWTLLAPGGATVLIIVIGYSLSDNDGHGKLWPLFLALAFFLYVWWLVAMVFDLVFIWHQYIRNSKYNAKVSTVRDWREKEKAEQYGVV